ncbi:MAG: lamin tail domain-containing protein, partial [Planctomycetota bacterium]
MSICCSWPIRAGTTASGIHLGFALDGDGEALYLYDKSGELLDSVEFGLQMPDMSVGRIGTDGQWSLTVPTPGQANIAQPLGDPATLKVNEWLASAEVLFDDDFVELYNPHDLPVDLSSLYITDNPVTQPDKHHLGPLSFIAGRGFAVLTADGRSEPGHVDFRLSGDGEMIALLDSDLNEIDKVLFGPQTTDVSQGRAPDGNQRIEFFELATPGVANPSSGPASTELIILIREDAAKRALVPTADIGQAWRTNVSFSDRSWTRGTPGPGAVGYERSSGYENLISLDLEPQMYGRNTSCYIRTPFIADASDLSMLTGLTLRIKYDDGFVAYLNGVEVARGNFSGTPTWNSSANASRSDSAAVAFEDIDISEFTGNL